MHIQKLWTSLLDAVDQGMSLIASVKKFIGTGISEAARAVYRFRKPLFGLALIVVGYASLREAAFVMPLKTPQEHWYNMAMTAFNRDVENHRDWQAFLEPEVPYFQRSILYFNNQAKAGLLDRILYGRSDPVLASQAYLKIGVILLKTSAHDDKLVAEARDYLEKAVALNPGIPFASEYLAQSGAAQSVNTVALMALAAERDLEMLYQHDEQMRVKRPGAKGKGEGKDGDKKVDDMKGRPDKPNAKPNDANGKPDKDAPAAFNKNLQQSNQDVTNSTGNDGI
ncbi:MAG: hypothetical protein P4L53_03795 [Candidatus Obscuribacterales bacterium]|nr:hypothetical protein [Candidatus Obscuribacterales bacterium]